MIHPSPRDSEIAGVRTLDIEFACQVIVRRTSTDRNVLSCGEQPLASRTSAAGVPGMSSRTVTLSGVEVQGIRYLSEFKDPSTPLGVTDNISLQ